jgi:hypothetical protein
MMNLACFLSEPRIVRPGALPQVNHICFRASLNRWEDVKVCTLTFESSHGGVGTEVFTTDVTIQKKEGTLHQCGTAGTACLEL